LAPWLPAKFPVTMRTATDVFIIGGGPAGLATAIAARRRGFDVIVADGASPSIDKACGEGLMPDGLAALGQLGVSVPKENSYPFRGIRFVSGGLSVDASFPQGTGIGIRRTVLHRAMAEHAEAMGVTLLWRTPVTGLHLQGVRLGNEIVRSRWIVGADGGHSLVRRWTGLDRYCHDRTRFAFRRHYRVAPWSDCMELHWGPRRQIYATPVAADEVCVALISRTPDLRLDDALAAFPELLARLSAAEPSSAERGAISSTRKLQRVYKDRVCLVGDASGAVDAITGEGLCLSFSQARLLAECMLANDLERYQRQHRVLATRPALMARLMLALDWKNSFRQNVMRALGSDPRLFARLLAMHVGALSPVDFAGAGLSLGWRMLRA
jgi:flavin-dependent dehydrogenase